MKQHTPAPEGYYEDDAEEVEGLDDALTLRARLQQRLMAVLGTSYGISVAVHLAILLILATIIIATPPALTEAKLSVRQPLPLPPEPPLENPALVDAPEIPVPETDVVQVVEDQVTTEIPMGEPDRHSDRMTELPKSFAPLAGLGPGGGEMAGRRGDGPPRDSGGGQKTQSAVRGALDWLMEHQAPDGRWEAGGWRARCTRGRCEGPGQNEGSADHDVGVTGLAMLAYLGAGNTHRFGKPAKYKHVVRRALKWLRTQQAADGSVGWSPKVDESIYDHAIATMALCESYTMTRDIDLKEPATRATQWLLAAQNPGLGWKYGVRSGRNDTSVTGWAVLALKAAKVAGIEVPDAAFDGAQAWFHRATDSEGEAGYETPGGGSSYLAHIDPDAFEELPVNTSVAVLCRILMGERRSADALRKGSKRLLARPPTWSAKDVNFYYWYYGTYAMFQVGGQPWFDWNEPMKAALLPSQRKAGGCEEGSWDPVDPWSAVGGRVYATAINALTLEIYYRYERTKEVPAPQPSGEPRERK